MKSFIVTLAIALTFALQPITAHAKGLGGGKAGLTSSFNTATKAPGGLKPLVIKSPVTGIGSKSSSISSATKSVPLTATGKKTVPLTAHSANARVALQRKLSGLSTAQQKANKTRTLSDGRVRHYTKETPARTRGKTRGASFVTEHNPRTNQVRQWMESYGHKGQVLRVHPKSLNGQVVRSPHYPPTAREQVK